MFYGAVSPGTVFTCSRNENMSEPFSLLVLCEGLKEVLSLSPVSSGALKLTQSRDGNNSAGRHGGRCFQQKQLTLLLLNRERGVALSTHRLYFGDLCRLLFEHPAFFGRAGKLDA